MNIYVSGKDASARLGICQATLRNYEKIGKIETIRVGNKRRYNVEKYLSGNNIEDAKRAVCYCRVSTHGQKDDLERQIEYMREKYPTYEIISDIGSGINFERPGLRQILKYAIAGELGKLVVAYKDRLCRIGYELIEYILVTYSQTLIIVDNNKVETINEEMANDIVQIMTVYTAKINGMRKYKKQRQPL